ncbi:MAG: segregation/condensation protein A [Fimbriimonadales bacterium]|nr:segregation/condensation protein A [Fimbriimonadales bacterium]
MRRFHIGSPEWSPPRVPLQLPLGFGSLGWLAHLIRKHKLDLLEIELAPVAQACYEYWREAGDLDEAADALATLAYLTERKAQRLLAPEPEPEPDDEPDWLEPARLPESYLPVLEWLRQREGEQMQLFYRGSAIDPREYELPPEFGLEVPDQLWHAFKRLLERRMPVPDAIPHRRYFSLHARMIEIRERLSQMTQPMPFDALATDALDIMDLLVSFLAMLELWRLGQIEVALDSTGTLWLHSTGDW